MAKRFLKKGGIIYLRTDAGKHKSFNFLNLYYFLFSGEKIRKGTSIRLKDENKPISLENFNIFSYKGNLIESKISVPSIIESYKDGKILTEIAEKYRISPSKISSILKENGINPSSKNCFRVPYKVNHSYFSEINDHAKAYWLGVLFSDGCVSSKSNQISLVSIDLEMIERFKKDVGFSGEIKTNSVNKKARYISFASIEMKNDLIKLGCVPQKSLTLEFPSLPKEFLWSFILGYFDGDGGLWVSKDGKMAHFKITSSTLFCQRLKCILEEHGFRVDMRREKNHKKETSYVRITSRKEIKRIELLLYKDIKFALSRKQAKFQLI